MLSLFGLRVVSRLSTGVFRASTLPLSLSRVAITQSQSRSFLTTARLELPTKAKASTKATAKKAAPKKKPAARKVAAKAKPVAKKRVVVKKKTSEKAKILPEDRPPTRPGSAYITFYKQFYKQLPKSSSVVESSKKGSAAWHALSEEEKDVYRAQSREAQAEYAKAFTEWSDKVDPAKVRLINLKRKKTGKRKVIRHVGPENKKPLTAYIRYFMEYRKAFIAEHGPDDSALKGVSELSKQAGAGWKKLTDAERKVYADQFAREIVAWKATQKVKAEVHARA